MRKHARLVIVGAGIAGASAAYHFARLGWKDVLLIDKGELWENDGSTSHAPGGVVALSHSRLLTQMAVYGADLMLSLRPFSPERQMVNPVGAMDLAASERRWQDLKRLHGESRSYGVDSHLLTPEQAREKHFLLNPQAVRGALFIPKGLIVAGAHVSAALAREAAALGGVEFLGHTALTDFEVAGGRVRAVLTSNPELPRIECEQVLLCANIWAPAISQRIDVPLPLMAFQHQYAITQPLPELSARFSRERPEDEVGMVGFRDVDHTLYVRMHWDSYGIGSYWHRPHMVHPREVGRTSLRPFTPEDFEAPWRYLQGVVPALGQVRAFTRSFNGMFAFPVDGYPMIGETRVKGVWAATGTWLTHAAGVAKSAAEWMTHGETEWDMRPVHVQRFQAYQAAQPYIDRICEKNYREIYDIVHPRQPPGEPRDLRLTPFHARFQALGAEFTAFAGIEVPNWFQANQPLLERYIGRIRSRSGWAAEHWSPLIGAEHLAAREHAGLFDLTGLAILEVSGPGALAFANRLCSNEMDRPVGSGVYSLWLTPGGGIRRDLTVARLAEDCFWMFVGDGSLPQDHAWVRGHLPTDGSVRLNDISSAWAALGLWGPRARDILGRVTGADLSNAAFPFYAWRWIDVGPARIFALRVSYAGELGWELHMPYDQGAAVWDVLWAAGQEHGLVAAGVGAFDSLRLEKGYRLWGADIGTEYNPYQAGLGWTVKLAKPDFIGREACLRLKAQPPRKRLVCLRLDDRDGTVLGYEPILAGGECVGYVTSGNTAYSLGEYIAYGYVAAAHAAPGSRLEVEYFGQRFPASVVTDPQLDPKGERLRA